MTDVPRPRALVFDVMGTVVDDVGGRRRSTQDVLTGRGDGVEAAERLSTTTADRLGELMREVNSGERPWTGHRDLTRLAVRDAVAHCGLEPLAAAGEDDLAQVVGRFEPWPDSAPGLARLRPLLRVVALTNAEADELAECSFRGGLAWHLGLSTRAGHAYKPDPRAYRVAVDALGLAPEELMMVAAHMWDLRAAAAEGLRTCYVLRPGVEQAPPGEFDLVVPDLGRLADVLDGR